MLLQFFSFNRKSMRLGRTTYPLSNIFRTFYLLYPVNFSCSIFWAVSECFNINSLRSLDLDFNLSFMVLTTYFGTLWATVPLVQRSHHLSHYISWQYCWLCCWLLCFLLFYFVLELKILFYVSYLNFAQLRMQLTWKVSVINLTKIRDSDAPF